MSIWWSNLTYYKRCNWLRSIDISLDLAKLNWYELDEIIRNKLISKHGLGNVQKKDNK